MSTQYTPGPWYAQNGGDVFTALGATTGDGWKAADNDGWHIADCRPGTLTIDDIGHDCELSSGEVLANARLIAAAPDMYEALKKIAAIDLTKESLPPLFGWYVLKAREALAKAEGKS